MRIAHLVCLVVFFSVFAKSFGQGQEAKERLFGKALKELRGEGLEIVEERLLAQQFFEAAVAIDMERLLPELLGHIDDEESVLQQEILVQVAQKHGKCNLALRLIEKQPIAGENANQLLWLCEVLGAQGNFEGFEDALRLVEPDPALEFAGNRERIENHKDELSFAFFLGGWEFGNAKKQPLMYQAIADSIQTPLLKDCLVFLGAKESAKRGRWNEALPASRSIAAPVLKLVACEEFVRLAGLQRDVKDKDLREIVQECFEADLNVRDDTLDAFVDTMASFQFEATTYLIEDNLLNDGLPERKLHRLFDLMQHVDQGLATQYLERAFQHPAKHESRALDWLRTVVEFELSQGNFVRAQELAAHYLETQDSTALRRVGINSTSLLRAALVVGDEQAVERYLRQLTEAGAGKVKPYPLASMLLAEGRPGLAKPYVEQLEQEFIQRLEATPEASRGKFVVDYLVKLGWQNRNSDLTICPIADAVIREFRKCMKDAEDTEVAERVDSYLASFTPTTQETKTVLLEMKSLLGGDADNPETHFFQQVHRLEALLDRVEIADSEDLESLMIDGLKQLKLAARAEDRQPHVLEGVAGQLAYAFAERGYAVGVDAFVSHVARPKDRAWIFLECSKVFPPKTMSIFDDSYFPPQPTGGFF